MTAGLRILRRKRGGRPIGISCLCRTGNKNENATAMFMLIHRRERKGEEENVCIFLFFVLFSLSSSPASLLTNFLPHSAWTRLISTDYPLFLIIFFFTFFFHSLQYWTMYCWTPRHTTCNLRLYCIVTTTIKDKRKILAKVSFLWNFGG